MNKDLHTVQVYNEHVNSYISKFMDLGLYKQTFTPLLENLPANARVLELGCGPGNVVQYLKGERQDLHFLGIDLAPRMIDAAKRANPSEQFEVMDITDAGSIQERFDAVIAAFCLPYLSYDDVPKLFRNMQQLTTDKGWIYVSCMEGTKERSGFEKTSFTGDDEMYINYYERKEIEELLKHSGFCIKHFVTKDYPEMDGSFTTDIFFLAKKVE